MFNWVIDKFRAAPGKFRRAATTETTVTKFVDLAPTATADNAGVYFDALDFATKNDEVLNIALTGPYGSGKSSVIKTFLKRYKGVPLQLSLASFLQDDEAPEKVSRQEIERSILQQILYGVDAHKLPFSRFKETSSCAGPSKRSQRRSAVPLHCQEPQWRCIDRCGPAVWVA